MVADYLPEADLSTTLKVFYWPRLDILTNFNSPSFSPNSISSIISFSFPLSIFLKSFCSDPSLAFLGLKTD